MGNTTIEVGSEDLTGLSLNLQAAPRIDVSIHAPANYTVGPNAVFIDLRPVNPALFHFFPDRQPDGSIRFQNVEPGTYWLVDRISDDHLCVESAKFQGQEVLRSPMKVTAGLAANLDVTLTTTCSTIQGAVFANNQPLPFATVTLLVSGSPGAPGDVFTENADKDGKFGIVGLPPGRYLLWAWGRDDPSYLGPMNLASVEAQAAAVVVGLGQTANTAVVAVAPPGAPK
jgi:hypothetical protein